MLLDLIPPEIFSFIAISRQVGKEKSKGGSFWSRGYGTADMTKGLVLGIYSREKENDVPQFTSAGENFDKLVSGKLREILNISGPPLKAGKTRTFYGLHEV